MAAKVVWYRGAWWVRTHYGGKKRDRRIGPSNDDKRAARKIAEQTNAKLVLGEFHPAEETPEEQPVRFDEFAASWFRTEILIPCERGLAGALSPNSVRQREEGVRVYLIPFFGTTDVRRLRVADIQRLYDHLIETGRPRSPRSIEIVLGTLRRVLLAAQAQEIIASNPVSDWKMLRGRRRGAGLRPIEREKVLTGEELEAVLGVARRDFAAEYPLLLFLADTGCRLGEGIGLEWRDLDLRTGVVRIERSVDHLGRVGSTKTRRPRTIELSTRLGQELVERVRPIEERSPVFPSAAGGYLDQANFRKRVFARVVRRALGLGRRLTPHSLRHTWASRHLAAGTPIKWVQAQGGWTTAKLLLDVYGHFLPGESRGFADVIAGQSNVAGRLYTSPDLQAKLASRNERLGKYAPRMGKRWSRRPDSNRRPADYELAWGARSTLRTHLRAQLAA